ncbi:hypothetical protein GIB67_002631 [Kingdonia uniflora]|uniref:J domain-containing protein n=1 Tax=Kingdonia uniflora TaxID=39325 RepID=A0A7J7N4T1_9MAGN|nr:hypothetical protein GIB67_002631 [Kingdonia uniflora]
MADFSHQHQQLQRPQASTFSKKLSSGNGFPTFSSSQPQIEDYSEIFGTYHRGSSIPILDLPVVDESDICIDVKRSSFDYSDIFGGFSDLEFAVPFQEMFGEDDKGGGGENLAEDVWTPAGTRTPSEGSSEDPACSVNNRAFSNGESHHSYDGVQQFNVSYHKTNQISNEDGISGTTCIAQLNAIPGFTLVVDESNSLKEARSDTPVPLNGHNLNVNFSGEMKEEKNVEKAMYGSDVKTLRNPSDNRAYLKEESITVSEIKEEKHVEKSMSRSDLKSHKNLTGGEAFPKEKFITLSEINLRTNPSRVPPPSRQPPKVAIRKEGSKRFVTSNSAKSTLEGAGTDGLPAFYDVEVDAIFAMKDAMEKAQATIKSAKESMERKKDGLQIRKKRGMQGEAAYEVQRFKEGNATEAFGEDAATGAFERSEKPKTLKDAHLFPDIEGREGVMESTKKALDQKLVREPRSTQESHKKKRSGEWKADAQFYELVGIDKFRTNSNAPGKEKDEKKLMPPVMTPEVPEGEIYDRILKEAREKEEYAKKLKQLSLQEHEKKLKEDREHAEREKKLNEAPEPEVKEKQEKETGIWEENENRLMETREWQMKQKRLEEARKREEHEAREREENEKRQKEVRERKENEKRQQEAREREENEKRQKEAREREENEKRQKEAREWEENLKRQKEACEREENEKRQKEAREREENEKKQKEAREREENEKRQKEAREREEKEKRQKEACEWEENEKRLKQARERDENEMRLKQVREREEIEMRLKEAHEQEEREKQLKEENEKQQKQMRDREENEKRLKEAHELEENEKRLKEACELEEIEKIQKEACEREEVKIVNEALEQDKSNQRQLEALEREDSEEKNKSYVRIEEEDIQVAKNFQDSEEKLKTIHETCKVEDAKNLEQTYGAYEAHRNNKPKAAQVSCEREENLKTGKAVKQALEHVHEKELTAVSIHIEQYKTEKLKEATTNHSAAEDRDFENKRNTTPKAKLNENEKKLGDSTVIIQETNSEKNKKTCQLAVDLKETKKVPRGIEDAKKNESSLVSKKINESSQSVCIMEEKGHKLKITEEREKGERIQKERALEKERIRKLEEDKERERGRDRMAVERATREARERAFAEARERAERAAVERATAEVRQRALSDARERLEKASAEVREKSLAEKVSNEARQRAERAAVERATVEARERAVEKAISEKAALEARERVERSVSEKFSAASRNGGMKQSSSFSDLWDSQLQSSSYFNSSQRYNSSNQASGGEKSQGIEAESAQRCKARLERHQRTVERAAKALAEKNTRDLQAQREQAERNRLAETLDADVRRWSSGKEGNLRALLSTLQYILGSESGWHPVPLTEVITAVAVKKAYRKATLCVHPDKLQQRGASIQQKYICEKVFDLLKDAWNKFNSEER